MNSFVWIDSHRIGVGSIDDDHKKLFDIANQIFAIEDPELECSKYRGIVQNLFHYINEHFFREESLMHKYDYPQIVQHKRLHDQLNNDLQNIMKKSQSIGELDEELKKMLDKWIINHIMNEDAKIKEWLDSLLTK